MQHYFVLFLFITGVDSADLNPVGSAANGFLGALIWARMPHFLNGECLPFLSFSHHDEKLITARHLNNCSIG
jgi:hypothetical protein